MRGNLAFLACLACMCSAQVAPTVKLQVEAQRKEPPCLAVDGEGHLKVKSGDQQESGGGGCCVFVPFFPGHLGCCAKLLYSKSTHTCCDGWQLVRGKHRDCFNNERFWSQVNNESNQSIERSLSHLLRTASREVFRCGYERDACGWKTIASNPYNSWQIHGLTIYNQNPSLRVHFRPSYSSKLAYIISPLLHTHSKQCLKFWYLLYDVTTVPTVSMEVIVQYVGQSSHLFTMTSFVHPASRWRHAFVDLKPGSRGIALGAKGSSFSAGSVAIDDVTITEGACGENVNCSFDASFCAWLSNYNDEVKWIKSGDFKEGYVEVEARKNSALVSTSTYISPPIAASEQCFKFSIRLNGSISVQVVDIDTSLPSAAVLWSAKETTNGRWVAKKIGLGRNKFHERLRRLELVATLADLQSAAVDDVTVTPEPCDVTSFDCDFYGYLCGWRATPAGLLKFGTEESVDRVLNNGDISDIRESRGYLYFDNAVGSTTFREVRRVLRSPTIVVTSTSKCFKIIYRIGSGSIKLYVKRIVSSLPGGHVSAGIDHEKIQPKTTSMPDLVLQAGKNTTTSWEYASLTLRNSGRYNIEIQVTNTETADVMIDDVSLTDGACSVTSKKEVENDIGAGVVENLYCDFDENSFCGWRQDHVTDDFDWQLNSGTTRQHRIPFLVTGPDRDHTTNNGTSGFYAYIASNQQSPDDVARLTSPVLKLASDSCFTFWHHIRGYETGNLTVLVETTQEPPAMLWTKSALSYDDSADWEMTHIDLPLTSYGLQSFRIVFEANVISYYGDIAIDDVILHNASCSRFLSEDGGGKELVQENSTKPPLLYSPATPSDRELESRFHASFVQDDIKNRNEIIQRGSVALLVDTSTSNCNQTGYDVIQPRKVPSVESSKNFLSNLVALFGKSSAFTLTSYAGWQLPANNGDLLTQGQTSRAIRNLKPMCSADIPLLRLQKAVQFLRHHVMSWNDAKAVVVVTQSLNIDNSPMRWGEVSRELGLVHSRLSKDGRKVIAVGIGNTRGSSTYYKSELSLISCGHVIHHHCDGVFFTDDVDAPEEVTRFFGDVTMRDFRFQYDASGDLS